MPISNSFISAFDPLHRQRVAGWFHSRPERELSWPVFLAFSICAGVVFFIVAFLFVVLADPYDTGRFAIVAKAGMPARSAMLGSASRGRDPAFNAAIFGNSTAMLLSPGLLSATTGRRFVTFASEWLGPQEDLTLLRWFARHRPVPADYVLVIDDSWCMPTIYRAPPGTFSPWLFTDDAFRYMRNLMQGAAFERALRRIRYLLGHLDEDDRDDGFRPWETGAPWDETRARQRLTEWMPFTPPQRGRYPAHALLRQLLATLPAQSGVVLVMPPVYVSIIPPAGSDAAAAYDDCKASVKAIVASRLRTAVLDHRVKDGITERIENFWDAFHYRGSIARVLEYEIAAAMAQWPG